MDEQRDRPAADDFPVPEDDPRTEESDDPYAREAAIEQLTDPADSDE
jgi:hypothetical protein